MLLYFLYLSEYNIALIINLIEPVEIDEATADPDDRDHTSQSIQQDIFLGMQR